MTMSYIYLATQAFTNEKGTTGREGYYRERKVLQGEKGTTGREGYYRERRVLQGDKGTTGREGYYRERICMHILNGILYSSNRMLNTDFLNRDFNPLNSKQKPI